MFGNFGLEQSRKGERPEEIHHAYDTRKQAIIASASNNNVR